MTLKNIPMKMYFMGEDVDSLPRERLIEAIRLLHSQLETARLALRSTIDIRPAIREAQW